MQWRVFEELLLPDAINGNDHGGFTVAEGYAAEVAERRRGRARTGLVAVVLGLLADWRCR